MKLTEKQKRFADYYVETANATEAAKRAGYKGKNLNRIASENLSKLDIKNYIDEKLAALESERIATASEVLQLLTSAARGELEEEVVVTVGVGTGLSETQIVKKKISLKERIKAAELIGKRYRLFTDKVEVDGVLPVMIIGEDELED